MLCSQEILQVLVVILYSEVQECHFVVCVHIRPVLISTVRQRQPCFLGYILKPAQPVSTLQPSKCRKRALPLPRGFYFKTSTCNSKQVSNILSISSLLWVAFCQLLRSLCKVAGDCFQLRYFLVIVKTGQLLAFSNQKSHENDLLFHFAFVYFFNNFFHQKLLFCRKKVHSQDLFHMGKNIIGF